MYPKPSVPFITVTELTAADTEYEIAFPPETMRFSMQARENVDVRIASESGLVASSTDPYWLLRKGWTVSSVADLWSGGIIKLYVAHSSGSPVTFQTWVWK